VAVCRFTPDAPKLGCVRVLIAPQAFKGSLTAAKVAAAIKRGLPPGCEADLLPMADGGEGTVDALVAAVGGRRRTATVEDPLGRQVKARWARLQDGRAVVEMAAGSGLPLLKAQELDPGRASTYGTGQLIAAALDSGATEVIIGLGGSATNDGGAGALAALGARLLDSRGKDLPPGALALARLSEVDLGRLQPTPGEVELRVMCDVSNPLLGPTGATAVYGPQKGVTRTLHSKLERALEHWADLLEKAVTNSKFQPPNPGAKLRNVPGAGAAGGLGFALLSIGGKIEPGAQLVLNLAHFDARVKHAELVITGEGRLDGQSLAGKATIAVARRAEKAGVPVLAIVGSLGDGFEAAYDQGLSAIMSITPGPMSIEDAQRRAAELTTAATEQAFRMMAVGVTPGKAHAPRHRRQ
jgi:glycerate 2-kinase